MNRLVLSVFLCLLSAVACFAQLESTTAEPGSHSTEKLNCVKETTKPMAESMFPDDAVIHRDTIHGTITLLKGKNLTRSLTDDNHFQKLQTEDRLEEIALMFLDVYRDEFRLDLPSDELIVTSVQTDTLGMKHVRFQQVFRTISVFACEITVHLNRSNHVYMVQGRYIPTPVRVNTCPVLNHQDAFRTVAKDLGGTATTCPGCRWELVIYTQPSGAPRLVYRVSAKPSLDRGWAYFIDAHTGEILKKQTIIKTSDSIKN